MAKGQFKWLMVANLIIACSASGWAQDVDAGKTEFQSSCAACHGADGKGQGPLSAELKSKPADLTVLAKKNNGVFPLNVAYEIIDGRKSISAHGTREMPIWGFRYTPSLNKAFSPTAADKYLNLSYDPEVEVRSRILAVVDYLNRIQGK
jgi:hypothetical protein